MTLYTFAYSNCHDQDMVNNVRLFYHILNNGIHQQDTIDTNVAFPNKKHKEQYSS